jgi:GTP-binding protein
VKFVDTCEVVIRAGQGGNGAVAFRREKFVPFGGPSGGDGGRGGDVIFVVDTGKTSLMDLSYVRALEAKHGEHGQGKDCYGRKGADLEVRVPMGTQVWQRDTGELLFDLSDAGARVVVAKGGRGGRGNMHFATPYDRAPRRSEPGEPGEEFAVRLELKVMADVGLLGFPNVGKSTIIAASSRARPKIADYPFTTLVPQLGVVSLGQEARESFVMADIPGLIPGAAEGAGLGLRFLKHVERTRALLHLVTLDPSDDREPVRDFDVIMEELRKFDPELATRPMVVALSKADLPEVVEAYPKLARAFANKGHKLWLVSAATHEGLRPLLFELLRVVQGQTPAEPDAALVDRVLPKKTATKAKKKAAPAKKTATKKIATKKTATKAKKTATKKTATKARKTATKKTATRKTATKKTATKKTATKKKKKPLGRR